LTFTLKRRIAPDPQPPKTTARFFEIPLRIVLLFIVFIPLCRAEASPEPGNPSKKYTILFYLNGDNDLTHEVLYALDMLETVGSSDTMNLIALVDGRSGSGQVYGDIWNGSRLVYVIRDDRIGNISSMVLKDLGEANLGAPETLESFIREGLEFQAERYIFCTFSHGRGIIDTKKFTMPGPHKSLAISVDDTDGALLTLPEFRSAIERGLGGKKFDAMVFFSCLTNMVEVGYELKGLTDYVIGSQDEIRIVNNPPGRFQIRGIKFEEPLKAILANPDLPIVDFGKITIDTFIEQYANALNLKDDGGRAYTCRYPASMALVASRSLERLAIHLDDFSAYIRQRLQSPDSATPLLKEIHHTLSRTQRFASFLNLEYYDAQDFLSRLGTRTRDERLRAMCLEIAEFVKNEVVVYEKHTEDCSSNGISIYLSNYLVPENIFQAHQAMYRNSMFSRDTSWDEMIESIRGGMKITRNIFRSSD
jgi:hypothetical protein